MISEKARTIYFKSRDSLLLTTDPGASYDMRKINASYPAIVEFQSDSNVELTSFSNLLTNNNNYFC